MLLVIGALTTLTLLWSAGVIDSGPRGAGKPLSQAEKAEALAVLNSHERLVARVMAGAGGTINALSGQWQNEGTYEAYRVNRTLLAQQSAQAFGKNKLRASLLEGRTQPTSPILGRITLEAGKGPRTQSALLLGPLKRDCDPSPGVSVVGSFSATADFEAAVESVTAPVAAQVDIRVAKPVAPSTYCLSLPVGSGVGYLVRVLGS